MEIAIDTDAEYYSISLAVEGIEIKVFALNAVLKAS